MTFFKEIPIPLFVGGLKGRIRLGAGNIRLRLFQRRLILLLFDREDQIALLDDTAVRNIFSSQKTVYASDQIHPVDCSNLADIFRTLTDFLQYDAGDRHRWWRRLGYFLGLVVTSCG